VDSQRPRVSGTQLSCASVSDQLAIIGQVALGTTGEGAIYERVCVCVCVEETKLVNPELLINVTCVSAIDKHRSKLSVWIKWQLPVSAGGGAQRWHSFIEVANDRRNHLDYIAETDSNHKRLDLPADQLFHIRVRVHAV